VEEGVGVLRFQSTTASCGPASLRTALLARGIVRSEDELASLAGFKASEGTSPKGIVRALAAIAVEHPEVQPALLSEARDEIAILRLVNCLMGGSVVILCVDDNEHWSVAFGLLGLGVSTIIHVYDPAETEMVKHYKPGELLARWRGPGKKPYYGIIV